MNKIIEISYVNGNAEVVRQDGTQKEYKDISRTSVERLANIYRLIIRDQIKGQVQPRKNGFSVYPE